MFLYLLIYGYLAPIVKPQYGRHFAVGLFKNWKDNKWETVEAYHKKMDNLIEYKEGALPEDNTNTASDESFTFGDGESYGLEFFIKRRVGKTTGWLGYTISKTTRYFEQLNNGIGFPAKYDRTHDLSLTATHELNENWVLSAIFVYATGNTLTPALDRYCRWRYLHEFADKTVIECQLSPWIYRITLKIKL